jgi:hypothetical protein
MNGQACLGGCAWLENVAGLRMKSQSGAQLSYIGCSRGVSKQRLAKAVLEQGAVPRGQGKRQRLGAHLGNVEHGAGGGQDFGQGRVDLARLA